MTKLLKPIRLQKILRDSLGISRRNIESLISEGRVRLNNIPAKPGDKIVSYSDQVSVDGKAVSLKPISKFVTLAINKPSRYMTTRSDEHGRRTIYSLLPPEAHALFPIGRLDFETEGLLILTNDGRLALTLTHPRYQVEKEYHVVLDKPLTSVHKKMIESGVMVGSVKYLPADIKLTNNPHEVFVTLREGKNREIRNIFAELGYKVIRLTRTRINGLKLEELKLLSGKYKKLTSEDVKLLRATS